MKKLTKIQLAKIDAMHGAWIEMGHKLTSYQCPHCRRMVQTRQPKKSMVSEKGYWDSARICLNCGELAFVCVYPSGKTSVKKM